MNKLVLLSEQDIWSGLRRLDELAIAASKRIEISLYGGAAMILAFHARQSTYDIDAIIREGHGFVEHAVRTVAKEKGWGEQWLNESIANFITYTIKEEFALIEGWENKDTGLVIQTAAPQYLLAMKCFALAGRAGEHDANDVKTLIVACGLRDTESVLEIVESFFPRMILPDRTKLAMHIQAVFESLKADDDSDAGPD